MHEEYAAYVQEERGCKQAVGFQPSVILKQLQLFC